MRRCGNPDCEKIWENDHVTICLECGWGTRAVEEIKKEDIKSEVSKKARRIEE